MQLSSFCTTQQTPTPTLHNRLHTQIMARDREYDQRSRSDWSNGRSRDPRGPRDYHRSRERNRDVGDSRSYSRDRRSSRDRDSRSYRDSRSPRDYDLRERDSRDYSHRPSKDLRDEEPPLRHDATKKQDFKADSISQQASSKGTAVTINGTPPAASAPATTSTAATTTEADQSLEAKRAAKLARVAEWKKKKEMEAAAATKADAGKTASPSPAPQAASKPAIAVKAGFSLGSLKPKAASSAGAAKRKMFFGGESDDEDGPSKRPLKTLRPLADFKSEKKSMKEENRRGKAQEEDPLEAFMSNLELPETSAKETAVNGNLDDATPMENTNVWEEIDTTEKDEDPTLDLSALSKKKEVALVDHSRIVYEDFRRQFYVENEEQKNMTEAEADELRLALDGMKVNGKDCPRPISKWTQLGLPGPTMGVLSDLRLDAPTSIQKQAIPAVMSGRDVLAVAKTGSGKTLAFLLPMLRHISHRVSEGNLAQGLKGVAQPLGIIITPTRELCVQIFRDLRPFLAAMELSAVCAYGGSPIKDQISQLKKGTHIVVCTPGRMIDLLAANQGRVVSLRRVTFLVIDEADRMFDMGFGPQVEKLTQGIRPDRQTVLFSATFPKKMNAPARKILGRSPNKTQGPVDIVMGERSVVAPEITQFVEVVQSEKSKFPRLLEVLGKYFSQGWFDEDSEGRVMAQHETSYVKPVAPAASGVPPKALIFVERQESADVLLKELIQSGYQCLSIHGSKDQNERNQSISDFKSGAVPVMVATSIAARGLDVKGLRLVVNYDSPNHMEDYVHRVGRTGRAGQKGTAMTFLVNEQERLASEISRAIRSSGGQVPAPVRLMTERFDFKVRAGTEKAHMYGYSGKGLERLQDERDAVRDQERKAYGEATGEEIEEPVKKESEPTNNDYSIIPKPVIVVTPPDSKADTTAYHTTLQINDFPQTARFRASSNTSVSKVIENTGCSITAKGEYYPPGRIPGPKDEPKLFILIEGTSERAVKLAHHELSELLLSGITKGTRYQV